MSDLYPTLLREEKSLQYGATLQNIVSLERPGNKMSKKLVVVIDGDRIDPVEYSSMDIKFEGDSVVVSVSTVASPSALPIGPDEDAPIGDGFIAPEPKGEFTFGGEDLEAFKMLSEFRSERNTITSENAPKETTIIDLESDVYNIQDMASIQNACFDLTSKESAHIAEGYKIVSVKDPVYIFETADNFKLVESATICKAPE